MFNDHRMLEPRKVHLFHDQGGDKMYGGRPFANTLCRMNSDVPKTHITSDVSLVTCKICRKDKRFKEAINAQFGQFAPQGSPPPAPLPNTWTPPAPIRYDLSAKGERLRYRRNWRGKLILQVEEIRNHSMPVGNSFDEWQSKEWRDATLADLCYPGLGVV